MYGSGFVNGRVANAPTATNVRTAAISARSAATSARNATVLRRSHRRLASICCRTLRRGGLAILPGDTIYGIFGAAPAAAARIRRIKGRAGDHPLLVLIPDPGWLWRCGVAGDPPERLLRYWPGALTIVFPRVDGGAVGVRVPDDPFLRRLVRYVGAPLYSTSVNRSGLPPLASVRQIVAAFGGAVDLIVDGGELAQPVASTVVDATRRPYRLLRPGAVELPAQVLTGS